MKHDINEMFGNKIPTFSDIDNCIGNTSVYLFIRKNLSAILFDEEKKYTYHAVSKFLSFSINAINEDAFSNNKKNILNILKVCIDSKKKSRQVEILISKIIDSANGEFSDFEQLVMENRILHSIFDERNAYDLHKFLQADKFAKILESDDKFLLHIINQLEQFDEIYFKKICAILGTNEIIQEKLDKLGLKTHTYPSSNKIVFDDSEISKLLSKVSFYKNRYDLSDIYTITLDKTGTYIKDDALSILKTASGGYIACFHVTDVNAVSYYKHKDIDDEFLFIPCKKDLSLEEARKHDAKTVIFEFSSDGFIADYKLVNSSIFVNKNVEYNPKSQKLKCRGSAIETVRLFNELFDKRPFKKMPTDLSCCAQIVRRGMTLHNCVYGQLMADQLDFGLFRSSRLGDKRQFSMKKTEVFHKLGNFDCYARASSPANRYEDAVAVTLVHELVLTEDVKVSNYVFWIKKLPTLIASLNNTSKTKPKGYIKYKR